MKCNCVSCRMHQRCRPSEPLVRIAMAPEWNDRSYCEACFLSRHVESLKEFLADAPVEVRIAVAGLIGSLEIRETKSAAQIVRDSISEQ